MNVEEEGEKVDLKLNIQKTKIMAFSPITSWQIDGETVETVATLFFWAPKSLQMVTAAMKLKHALLLGRKVMTNLDSIFKSRDITLSTKVRLVKDKVFPVVMHGCENWTMKKAACRRTVALKTLESPLDCKEIQPVHPKGDQSWVFMGRTDAEAEAPVL